MWSMPLVRLPPAGVEETFQCACVHWLRVSSVNLSLHGAINDVITDCAIVVHMTLNHSLTAVV